MILTCKFVEWQSFQELKKKEFFLWGSSFYSFSFLAPNSCLSLFQTSLKISFGEFMLQEKKSKFDRIESNESPKQVQRHQNNRYQEKEENCFNELHFLLYLVVRSESVNRSVVVENEGFLQRFLLFLSSTKHLWEDWSWLSKVSRIFVNVLHIAHPTFHDQSCSYVISQKNWRIWKYDEKKDFYYLAATSHQPTWSCSPLEKLQSWEWKRAALQSFWVRGELLRKWTWRFPFAFAEHRMFLWKDRSRSLRAFLKATASRIVSLVGDLRSWWNTRLCFSVNKNGLIHVLEVLKAKLGSPLWEEEIFCCMLQSASWAQVTHNSLSKLQSFILGFWVHINTNVKCWGMRRSKPSFLPSTIQRERLPFHHLLLSPSNCQTFSKFYYQCSPNFSPNHNDDSFQEVSEGRYDHLNRNDDFVYFK